MTRRTKRQQRLRGELLRQREQLIAQERRERELARSSAVAEMGAGMDQADLSEFDLQADLDLALLQMRSETVRHIDRALTRLDAGTYGVCEDCGAEIAEPRLRALPFAEHCRPCEETNEATRTLPQTLRVFRTPAPPFEMNEELNG